MIRRRLTFLALCMLVAACNNDAPTEQSVVLDDLGFEVPAAWRRTDANRRGVETSIWVPAFNDRKEALTVIRTTNAPPLGDDNMRTIAELLVAAQPPGATVGSAEYFKTERGVPGVRVALDYVPPGLTQRYHRVHAVLVGRTGVLVHVLYTALRADSNSKVLSTVLSTISEES